MNKIIFLKLDLNVFFVDSKRNPSLWITGQQMYRLWNLKQRAVNLWCRAVNLLSRAVNLRCRAVNPWCHGQKFWKSFHTITSGTQRENGCRKNSGKSRRFWRTTPKFSPFCLVKRPRSQGPRKLQVYILYLVFWHRYLCV